MSVCVNTRHSVLLGILYLFLSFFLSFFFLSFHSVLCGSKLGHRASQTLEIWHGDSSYSEVLCIVQNSHDVKNYAN